MDLKTPDRRGALKERHRQAIVDAAAALMAEGGGIDFTVDDLAARADVSRRTVFNHFASVDDIVTTVCTDVLGGVVETFVARAAAAPTGSSSSMFDEIAHALRTTDLVTPMAYVTRTLGVGEDTSPWRQALMVRSVHDLTLRFAVAMAARHPEADPLEVDLMANSLMSGLMVLHGHWYAATGATDDDASRRVWAGLVERLLTAVGTGYGAAPHP